MRLATTPAMVAVVMEISIGEQLSSVTQGR